MAPRVGTLSSPIFVKSLLQDAKPVEATAADIVEQTGGVDFIDKDDSIFKYDPLNFPLKSTQQLNVDWSKFENHTFFSSAEVKVNEAFDLLINKFPFDGTKNDVQKFLDKLTGFEKYIFDQFPSWSGALQFSGTQAGEDVDGSSGTWISVKDSAGYLYPEISKNSSGNSVINPASGSFSIETLIYLPTVTNDTQVVLQKSSTEKDGFTFHLLPSTSTSYVTASFSVTSGSVRNSASAVLTKGIYNHVCLVFNKEIQDPDLYLQFYVNEKLAAVSDKIASVGKLDIDNSNLLIGTGSSFYLEQSLITPTQTFSGSLDELRIFHSVRTLEKQKLFAARGIYSTEDLKLYYRFNEPPPPLTDGDLTDLVNGIVLDSSGNSLHSVVNNFTGSLRINVELDSLNPIRNEKKEFNIVLFPAQEEVKSLNNTFLVSASLYDSANPNMISRLIPKHYLLEGADDEGFYNELGNAGQSYGGSGLPGQGEIGSTHIILSFLYIWAKFFDDIKMFIDAFGSLRTVGYDLNDTVPDAFLNDIIKSYGFYLPAFFNHANLDKYLDDSDGPETQYTSGISFKSVHSQILRRVIVNINDIIRSKGTQHSIRSFLRSVGIDPDNSLKIREYGGPTTKTLGTSRNKKIESIPVIDFVSSSLITSNPLSLPFSLSSYPNSSRVEPGFPKPWGFYMYDVSGDPVSNGRDPLGTSNASDSLLTSGSWTIECLYKFPPYKLNQIGISDQSLMRLITTGSNPNMPNLIANVVAIQKTINEPSYVRAYLRPGSSTDSPLLTLSVELSGAGVFDGERWNVSLGRKRSDEFNSSYLSSSYYLRVGKSNYGELEEVYTQEKFFNEKSNPADVNLFEVIDSAANASGSIISLGSNQTIPKGTGGWTHLNDTSVATDQARTTNFYGWLSHLRFWSKSTTESEWKEHVRNFTSAGVSDPKLNYNFVKNESGSFNKLRMETLLKQQTRNADSNGNIIFLDHSGNNNIMLGTSFGSGSSVVVVGDVESYSYLSPEFDESSTDDKVRIRGLFNENNFSENPWAITAPVYSSNEFFIREEPQDDLRLSIEFSLTDALDRDIITMFSDLDSLGDAIGKPENMFSPDYADLEILRDVYFNRLTAPLNFRNFLEFYRWFDNSISTFIEQLVPGKTRYKGTNFVVESHMLERHKRESRHNQNYIKDNTNVDVGQITILSDIQSAVISK